MIALAPTDFRGRDLRITFRPRNFAFITILPAGDGDVAENNGARFYDQAVPSPFKSQLYVHYANHNFFNRQWLNDDHNNRDTGPPVMARWDHERVLAVYGCAFFRRVLLNHSALERFLSGYEKPSSVFTDNIHLSFEKAEQITVDNHQEANGIGLNSLGQITSQSGGLSADEFPFRQDAGAYNASFYGNSIGMVARRGGVSRQFRSEIGSRDLRQKEIWIRVSEVSERDLPPDATGFQLGLEDSAGNVAWVDSDEVSSLTKLC